jgi:SAM-dependent methyltransferase
MNIPVEGPPVALDYFGKERREIAPLLPAACESVLEIGCGTGATMRWLRERRTIGYAAAVEFSPNAAAAARQVFDDLEIGDASTAAMAFRRDRFDLILALDVLEHLTAPEKMLARLRDRLTETGTIIISLPNVAHYLVSIPLLGGRWDYQDEGTLDRTHMRFFNERTARGMVEDAGLRVTAIRYNFHYPSVLYPFGLQNRKWLWYSRQLMKYVLIWPKHLFRYQFLLAAHLP